MIPEKRGCFFSFATPCQTVAKLTKHALVIVRPVASAQSGTLRNYWFREYRPRLPACGQATVAGLPATCGSLWVIASKIAIQGNSRLVQVPMNDDDGDNPYRCSPAALVLHEYIFSTRPAHVSSISSPHSYFVTNNTYSNISLGTLLLRNGLHHIRPHDLFLPHVPYLAQRLYHLHACSEPSRELCLVRGPPSGLWQPQRA